LNVAVNIYNAPNFIDDFSQILEKELEFFERLEACLVSYLAKTTPK
jgi:hypothetical protein